MTNRGTASLPQTTASALFKVQGGRVLVMGIYGEVTTIVQTQTNNAKLISDPTVGADVDLCATLDLTADAVGTMYGITGDFSDAMKTATSGALEIGSTDNIQGVVVAAGNINLSCSASSSGEVKWSILWRPLDEYARVVRA